MNSNSREFQLLVTQRKNKKSKRKRKGKNTASWEQLRERGVLGIDTLQGGGLVSAPIAGKALPKIGKRLFRRFAKFNPDPIDADRDKLVQEGTQFERIDNPSAPALPKPPARTVYENTTPYGGTKRLIREQRNQTKKFQAWAKAKNWKRFHSEHFDWWTFPIDRGSIAYGYKYTPPQEEFEKLKRNIPYLDSLRRAASLYLRSMAWDMNAGDWIDNPDFDRGQEPLVNINQARLFKIARSMQMHGLSNELRSVRRMVQSLRDAGVKVGNDDYWNNPYAYTYAPLNPINTPMQQALPNPQSSIGQGVTGAMGISYTPRSLTSIDGGPQRFDIDKEPGFRKRYDDMDADDEAAYIKRSEIQARDEGGKIKDIFKFLERLMGRSYLENFYWRDDRTRKIHASYLGIGSTDIPQINQATGKRLRLYPATTSERNKKRTGVTKNWPEIASLFEEYFGWIQATKTKYPAMYDLSQSLFASASTPKDIDTSTAQVIKDMLGVIDKYTNPTNYMRAFEEWIRNPTIVAKNSKGELVGVRLALNNDRKKLLELFDSRIDEVKTKLAKILGIEKSQLERDLSPDLAARKYLDETPDIVVSTAIESLRSLMQNNDDFKMLDTIEQVADNVAITIQKGKGLDEKSRGFNGEVLKQILERPENISLYATLKKQKPQLFNVSPFDSLPSDVLGETRGLIELYLFDVAASKTTPTMEGLRELVKTELIDDETLSALVAERINVNPKLSSLSADRIIPNSGSTKGRGVSGNMASNVGSLNATNTSMQPDNPSSIVNHSVSLPSAYKSLQEPTESLQIAAETGRPISWLMPGQLHPLINEEYNKMVQDVRELGVQNVISLASPDWKLSESGAFTPDEVKKQEEIISRFNKAIKFKYMAIFQGIIASLGEKDNAASQLMALGLVQRAANQAARANFLENKFKSGQMTEEILENLEDATDSIFDTVEKGFEERVVIATPISVVGSIFKDGRYKTQIETNTSQGSFNPDLRKVQELAMFSIHPNAKQRPIYGTINRGMDEDIANSTSQYGGAKIVLRDSVNARTTWTQADSLSQQTNASTLRPDGVSWDGLYGQSLHPRTKQAYFMSAEMARMMMEYGREPDYESWPFIEAQVHGGISVDDISHIIIDEEWFENNPEFAAHEFGEEYDEYNWQESPGWIQISKVAQSLNIPIVMLREGLAEYEVLEEPGR